MGRVRVRVPDARRASTPGSTTRGGEGGGGGGEGDGGGGLGGGEGDGGGLGGDGGDSGGAHTLAPVTVKRGLEQ